MSWLRSAFQDELDGVTQTLVDLSALVSDAISRATHALLTADIKEAEEVIASDDRVDDIQHELDARIIDIIARQQPVASDLRALVTALRMSADLERMGDMAHHIAKSEASSTLAMLRRPWKLRKMMMRWTNFIANSSQLCLMINGLTAQKLRLILL
jgi:phosphate uptake regulator